MEKAGGSSEEESRWLLRLREAAASRAHLAGRGHLERALDTQRRGGAPAACHLRTLQADASGRRASEAHWAPSAQGEAGTLGHHTEHSLPRIQLQGSPSKFIFKNLV